MSLLSIYSKMPIWLQDLAVQIYSYKIEYQRYGKDYRRMLASLIESDKWTSEQIRLYKEANLRRIITYAYEHTSFYKEWFDSHGVHPNDFQRLEDLQKFPVLTKEDVRENWKKMVSDEYKKKDLIRYHTSGSTGKALDFYWTKECLKHYWACFERYKYRLNLDVQRKSKHINFTGKIVVPLSQNKPPYWRFRRAQNQYMLNMQHITPEKIKDIVDFINDGNFVYFIGYPSIMNSLAETIREAGLKITNPPKYIFPSAEKLYDFQKENISSVFHNVRFFEHYGFSENAGCASKGPDGYYHEDFEHGHLELIDQIDLGDTVTGKLVATGFKNYGMPFIRYEIGDTATFAKENHNAAVIQDIEGRNGDYVVTPEGAKIMRFGYIFKETDTIKECQIVQNCPGEIIIRMVPRKHYDASDTEAKMRQSIREWISPTINVVFEYVESIPRTSSGKFKAVISNLSN